MGLRAELTAIPGPVDPHSGRPSEQAPYEGAIEDFLATPGVSGTDVAAAFRRVLTLAAQETAEGADWWGAVRRFFAPEVHTVVAVGEQPVELEGYWMTLPDVKDASVKLTVTVGSSRETAASFTIAGIGGGPTFTIDLKEGLSHQAAVCERIALSTMGVFQRVEVTQNGNVIGTYPRLVTLDLDNLDWDFDPATPPSASTLGNPMSSRRFDQSASNGSTTITLEISRGTTWEMSAGLSLANLGGIEAKLSAKATYQRDVAVECTLPGNHHYLATRYAGFPAYLWSLE
jgi:hypothetical protein